MSTFPWTGGAGGPRMNPQPMTIPHDPGVLLLAGAGGNVSTHGMAGHQEKVVFYTQHNYIPPVQQWVTMPLFPQHHCSPAIPWSTMQPSFIPCGPPTAIPLGLLRQPYSVPVPPVQFTTVRNTQVFPYHQADHSSAVLDPTKTNKRVKLDKKMKKAAAATAAAASQIWLQEQQIVAKSDSSDDDDDTIPESVVPNWIQRKEFSVTPRASGDGQNTPILVSAQQKDIVWPEEDRSCEEDDGFNGATAAVAIVDDLDNRVTSFKQKAVTV